MSRNTITPIAGAGAIVLAIVVAVAGLIRPDAATSEEASVECPSFGSVSVLGRTAYKDMGLVEASGLIASRRNPGVFWTHNDNAGENVLFAVDVQGRILAKFWLAGYNTESFEDISFGPGRNGEDAIYIGDTGDNRNRRDSVTFVRVPEPTVDPSWHREHRTIAAGQIDQFTVAYRRPGTNATWSRDVEAFAFDPISGNLVIFEKRFFHKDGKVRQSWVYEVPAADMKLGRRIIAEPITHVMGRVGDVGAGFTAADISPDGRWIIVKNMFESFVWPRRPGEPVAAALSRHNVGPCAAPVEKGEAVGFLPDGSGLLMIREGKSTPVWYASMSTESAPTTTAPATTAPTTTVPDVAVTVVGADHPTCWGRPATIVGTAGNDELTGTDGDDVIVGLGGDDVISGLGGDDVICGDSGDDVLRGGPGHDRIYAGGGADTVHGGDGNDLLRGHGGPDVIDGDAGRDVVAGNAGDDLLRDSGPPGVIKGGSGIDVCEVASSGQSAWTCETVNTP